MKKWIFVLSALASFSVFHLTGCGDGIPIPRAQEAAPIPTVDARHVITTRTYTVWDGPQQLTVVTETRDSAPVDAWVGVAMPHFEWRDPERDRTPSVVCVPVEP
jgi:hypothetical protein